MKGNYYGKLMRKVLIFLSLFFSLTALAQNSFSGKITDQNNQNLSKASIKIVAKNAMVLSNAEGEFSFEAKNTAETIEISHQGYVTKTVQIYAEKPTTIVLKVEENVLDAVFVNAVRVKDNAPIAHSNISKKEIEKTNLGQDIPYLIQYLPSVVSSSDAGAGIGYTYLRIRGSDETRTNVTINGIPYNDPESQGVFWVNINDLASSTESLQVQRGVGTSTNGSGAFGASINILTDAVSKKAGASISNSFGSYGTRKHTGKFTTGLINDHIEFSGRISEIYSNGYIDRAFVDLNSHFLQGVYKSDNTLIKAITFGGSEQTYQAWYGTPKARLTGDAAGIEAYIENNYLSEEEADNLRNSDRRYNYYTYDNETDNYWQDHYQLHWNQKWSNNWSTNIGLNYTNGEGYFEQFKPEETAEDFDNLIIDGSDVIVRRWLDNDFYVVNGNVTYKNNNFEVIAGASLSDYTNDHFGEVIWGEDLAENTNIRDHYYDRESNKADYSTFIKTNVQLTDKLELYGDLQYRYVNYNTEGLTSDRVFIDVNKSYNFFNPKAGLSFNINKDNNLYASYARANREPNGNDFENGTFDHETLDDFEAGWRFKSELFQFNLNAFYMNYSNQLVLSGQIDDTGAALRETSGSSYRVGAELELNIQPFKQVAIQPNFAISRNRNRDFTTFINGELQNLGETSLSFSPDVIVNNAIVIKPIQNLEMRFISKYVGKQFMSNLSSNITTNDVLTNYDVHDINIIYEIKINKIFKSIIVNGLINNIFSKKYVNRGYYGTYDYDGLTYDFAGYYPQAERNFLLGATFKF